MSKSDHEFVNFSDEHEMKYALKTNGFRETFENVSKLIDGASKIKTYFNKTSTQNLTWEEMHEYLSEKGVLELDLEKA